MSCYFEEQCISNRIKVDNDSEFINKALDKWAYETKYN